MHRSIVFSFWGAFFVLAPAQFPSAQQQPVTAFAAASLQDALATIGKNFAGQTGVTVRFSFASSAALVSQIDQGAPADIFASADVDWMDWAQVDLPGNKLVIVAPSDARFSAIALERNALLSAIGQSRLATGEVNSVPAGLHAKVVLEQLGLLNDIQPRPAHTENIRAALALVARGEAPLRSNFRSGTRCPTMGTIAASMWQSLNHHCHR